MLKLIPHLFTSIILLNLVSGCGGSADSATEETTSMTINPSLGLVTNATVQLYQSDSTTLLAEGDTGSTGIVNIEFTGSYKGPIIVVVEGDADAQYYDEAASAMVAFGAGQLLRAIVPSSTTQTAVTMLTEASYQLSAVNQISLTDANINLK